MTWVKKLACGANSWIKCGIFSCPSGAKVSWSRAPPPKVITMIFRFFAAAAPRTKGLALSKVDPSATPAAPRRKSRRLRPRCSAIFLPKDDWAVNSHTPHTALLLGGRIVLGCRDKLPNLCSFLVELSHMLRSLPLIDGKLRLGTILLPGVHVVLAEAVVGVRKIRIQFQRSLVFRDRLHVFMLVSI